MSVQEIVSEYRPSAGLCPAPARGGPGCCGEHRQPEFRGLSARRQGFGALSGTRIAARREPARACCCPCYGTGERLPCSGEEPGGFGPSGVRAGELRAHEQPFFKGTYERQKWLCSGRGAAACSASGEYRAGFCCSRVTPPVLETSFFQ